MLLGQGHQTPWLARNILLYAFRAAEYTRRLAGHCDKLRGTCAIGTPSAPHPRADIVAAARSGVIAAMEAEFAALAAAGANRDLSSDTQVRTRIHHRCMPMQ
jgi:hypothetical protein